MLFAVPMYEFFVHWYDDFVPRYDESYPGTSGTEEVHVTTKVKKN